MDEVQNEAKMANNEEERPTDVAAEQQPTTVTGEFVQTEIVQLTVVKELHSFFAKETVCFLDFQESAMPIEDLRKLYTTSTSITNVPTPKQEEEMSSSEEDTSDEDEDGDSGYQRLLIVEHPTSSKDKRLMGSREIV